MRGMGCAKGLSGVREDAEDYRPLFVRGGFCASEGRRGWDGDGCRARAVRRSVEPVKRASTKRLQERKAEGSGRHGQGGNEESKRQCRMWDSVGQVLTGGGGGKACFRHGRVWLWRRRAWALGETRGRGEGRMGRAHGRRGTRIGCVAESGRRHRRR